MATVTEPPERTKTGFPERFVFWGISWQQYDTLLEILEDRNVRTSYDRGNLEIMTTSSEHEVYSDLIDTIIKMLMNELDIPYFSTVRTTWRRVDLDRGLEPDESYYIGNAHRVNRMSIDLKVDPPPDLAVEIEISCTILNRIPIYAALGIPELWRFDGQNLTVMILQPDGAYTPSSKSLSFPFLPIGDVVRLVKLGEDMLSNEWTKVVIAWVREELMPGFRGV